MLYFILGISVICVVILLVYSNTEKGKKIRAEEAEKQKKIEKILNDEMLEEILKIFNTKTEKDCFNMIPVDEEPDLMDNKIGGIPYFPENEIYPMDKSGNPMFFLFQVNLDEIDLKGFPKEGILEVFVGEDCCEEYDNYQIKIFDKGLQQKENLPNAKIEVINIEKPIKIKLEKNKSYMSMEEYRCQDIVEEIMQKQKVQAEDEKMKDIIIDKIMCYISEKNNEYFYKSTIGGYAEFIQGDPRDADLDEKYNECLFKINSRISDKINIEDNGIVNGLINSEDRIQGRLNKAKVYIDSF